MISISYNDRNPKKPVDLEKYTDIPSDRDTIAKLLKELNEPDPVNEKQDKTICFTGRRPKDLCGYDWMSYKSFGKSLIDHLEKAYQNGYKNFISGGAQGFDQIAFWAVNALKKRHEDIRNIVYIPFEGQDSSWAETGPFSRKEYERMLSVADEVKLLVPRQDVKPPLVSYYLLNRNKAMVNDSDLIVALYPDDSYKTASGGTAHCMRYALEQGKNIHEIQYHIGRKELVFDKVIMIRSGEEKKAMPPKEIPKKKDPLNLEFLKDKNIICFDTETTGLSKKDEILQLTITAFKNGEPEVIYSGYFKPDHHYSWPEAMEVHHITPAMLKDKPYIKDCISDFKDIFEKADIIAGYNVKFDIRLLEQSIGEGVINIPDDKVFDVCSYFKKAEPKVGHKLIEAMQFYCPEKVSWFENNAHDASADSLATLYVLKAQAEKEGVDLFADTEKTR